MNNEETSGEIRDHVDMSAVIDTNVIIRAARLNMGVGGPLDRRDRELFGAASRTLSRMGRALQFDGCSVTFRPVVNATVLAEIRKTLHNMNCTADQVQLVLNGVKGLLVKTGGSFDKTGHGDELYRKLMSKRSRQHWGTGAGDESVLDTALRYSAVIVTEDGLFADYARRRGVHVYKTGDVAGIQVAAKAT